MAESGLLLEVRWEWDGTEVTAAASLGASAVTVLDVSKVAVSDVIWVGSASYAVTGVEGDVVSFAPALAEAVKEGEPVVPDVGGGPGQVWLADVLLPDADQPIEVPLTVHDLAVMSEGTYDPPRAITLSDDLQSVIDLPGSLPVVPGEFVNPDGLPLPDPETPPEFSPVPEPIQGPASVVVNYTPIPGQWADLYVWVPPVTSPADTPPSLTSADLLIEQFPPGGFVYVDHVGQPLPADRPVWVALWGRNEAGEAPVPSAWFQSSVGQILPEHMMLLAGTVIAQRLQSETLTSVTITASILDIVNALYVEPNYMEVKAALVEAQSAIFYDNVTRRGVNNYLAGHETASSGVTDPGTPPTVTNHWNYVELPSDLVTTGAKGMAVDTANGEFALVTTGLNINVYNLTTGAFVRTLASVIGGIVQAADITYRNNYYYVLQNAWPANDFTVKRYHRTTGLDAAYTRTIALPLTSSQNGPASVVFDIWDNGGTETFSTIHANTSGEYRYREWNAATGAGTISYLSLPGGLVAGEAVFVGLEVGLSGGIKVIQLQRHNAGLRRWEDFMSLVLDDSNAQSLPYGELLSAADGGYTLDTVRRFYTHDHALDDVEYDYTYTWYDSDSGGLGVGESRPSPVRSFTTAPGAAVLVKTPLPPDDGTSDAPNTVRVYIDNHRQTPEYSDPELGAGRVFEDYDDAGAGAPIDSDFDDRLLTPGGYSSAAGDLNGPIWWHDGDGPGRAGPLLWEADGSLTWDTGDLAASGAYAGSVRFTKIGDEVSAVGNVSRASGSGGGAFTATGITVPTEYRPAANFTFEGKVFYGTADSYRYRITTTGALEVQMSAANTQNMTVNDRFHVT
jgi:hypothetical protein